MGNITRNDTIPTRKKYFIYLCVLNSIIITNTFYEHKEIKNYSHKELNRENILIRKNDVKKWFVITDCSKRKLKKE